eukprot:GHVN01028098.1.p1 GENE.GHVN01028098.1~~GHVN01028098.1.p1  ORF type:complete len:142 (+),score=9.31 GHVN01028098.1:300-725(+)
MLLTSQKVKCIPNPHSSDVEAWMNSGFTKLTVWNLTQFKKVVYIDADCLVTTNIDELFERPAPAFAPDVFPPDHFNAGVMVLEPDSNVFNKMIERKSSLPSYDKGVTRTDSSSRPYLHCRRYRLPQCFFPRLVLVAIWATP